MFSLRRYIAVAKKEFLELRRNVLFFLMTILAPMLFYFLFVFGFPLDAKNISIGVVDLDKTMASRELISSFENATDLFRVKFVTNDLAYADGEISKGNLRMVLTIPHDFGRKLTAGRPIALQGLIDGAYPNTASLVGANSDAVVSSFNYNTLYKFLLTRPGFEGGAVSFTPIDLSVSGWYNSSFRSEDFIIPAIIALVMVFFPPIVSAISLAREKETGSILNMYCSSLRKTEYLLGKMTPYIIISYINFVLFIVISVFGFNVPMRGSVLTLLFSGFFYVSAVIGIGLLIAVLVKSQVAAILITFVGTVMPAFLYSGFMVPMSSMDESARYSGYSLPTTYFMDIARKLMVKGSDIKYIWLDVVVTILFCLVIYILCIKFFKKRVG